MRRPKAVLVPFGYPEYPKEMLERFTRESVEAIKREGIDLKTTRIMITSQDVEPVKNEIRQVEFDFLIPLIISWVEAPNMIAVLREYFSKPMLLWSHTVFKEGDRLLTLGAIPGAGVIRETLEEMGANFKFIWGMPEEKEIQREIRSFSKSASTVNLLSHAKVGLLGYASMGMYTGTFDHVSVRKILGPEVEQIDQYILIKKIEEMDNGRVDKLLEDFKKTCEIAPGIRDEDIKKSLKMYIALKEIVGEFSWNALTVKCQYELSRHYKCAPCVPLSMLANEIPCSCEGDIPLILTQLMLYYLTQGAVTSYGDLHNITEKELLLAACGFAPFGMATVRPRVEKQTTFYEGLSNSTNYKEGRVTLARLASDKGGGYKMHLETGESLKAPPFNEVGAAQYPSMLVKIDGSGKLFGENIMSQHYAIVYGDFKKEMLELTRLLNIRVVLN